MGSVGIIFYIFTYLSIFPPYKWESISKVSLNVMIMIFMYGNCILPVHIIWYQWCWHTWTGTVLGQRMLLLYRVTIIVLILVKYSIFSNDFTYFGVWWINLDFTMKWNWMLQNKISTWTTIILMAIMFSEQMSYIYPITWHWDKFPTVYACILDHLCK